MRPFSCSHRGTSSRRTPYRRSLAGPRGPLRSGGLSSLRS